ncbi:MAG: TonB-dependent receptor [Cyclobacteriaceae bacterium]|nr:TonB-dependent receptor [Cyclobacteriaceae bacterium]
MQAELAWGQGQIKGIVSSNGTPIEFVHVHLLGTNLGTSTNAKGEYIITQIPAGNYTLSASMVGFATYTTPIRIAEPFKQMEINISLLESELALDEVVISGTMKEVSRLESPVPVEVYSPLFFRANPTPSIFESLQNVNGVRAQINCNVCNTGDIHINGLEGPYTMVLIDGMPIVSGLSTVYGLTGIPQSLIQRVEIVKGPASTLYGSEAVGGLINIITKNPLSAPVVSVDAMSTSWGEYNADIGVKWKVKKAHALVGVNYFNYQNPIDNNHDGFTDLTLQHRISLFNKWNLDRKDHRVFNMAIRYIGEDRWGGQVNWTPHYRGGNERYGESIYTNRWELLGQYQLPVAWPIQFQYSATHHHQNSYYGTTYYDASQFIAFGQLSITKRMNSHDLLIGTALRYNYYDDNTPATASLDATNRPSIQYLPGVFIQDEITLNRQNKLLAGIRYDHNTIHGAILSPRLNYKWSSVDKRNNVRLSVGNGYRVANVFTEDHAALTGAREVIFQEDLKPETSWNVNVNWVKKVYTQRNAFITFDATTFYTHFLNRIIPDYESDPNKIIYANLNGFAVSKGVSLSMDVSWPSGLKAILGSTWMDVSIHRNGISTQQLLTERFSGVWNIGYPIGRGFTVDYTGNLYGPMRLPLLGPLDPRSEYSPWWSIQNIQLTKTFAKGWEIYGGVKNLLNYTPPANSIARAFDPFDKQVQFDANGQVLATPANPHALTFDPTYVFAPNQGIRGFVGVRFTWH